MAKEEKKQELIDKYYPCTCAEIYKGRRADPSCVRCYEGEYLTDLMDEYAEHIAIAFRDWAVISEWEVNTREQRTLSTSELYQVYITTNLLTKK